MDALLQQKIDELKGKNLLRVPKSAQLPDFINFTSNDYLGLSCHPEVIRAGAEAAEKYGAGAGASRIAGGNHPLYDKLEEALAKAKGTEAACVFGSGYLTNIGVIPALVGEGDIIFADRLSHACIIDGAKLSGAKLVRFNHNDLDDLRRRLTLSQPSPSGRGLNDSPSLREGNISYTPSLREGVGGGFKGKKLIITEEIFSMDGDKAPLAELKRIAEENDAWLMVDGAHSLYQPATGNHQHIYIGTLSKAIGAYGGYVAGSKTLIEYIKTKARSLIYSTALPPFVIASALKSLEVIEREKPYLKTLENTKHLLTSLRAGGEAIQKNWIATLPAVARDDELSAIVPIIFGSNEKALEAEQKLREGKILVSAIRPPTVPENTARLRVSISALHEKAELDKLAATLNRIIK